MAKSALLSPLAEPMRSFSGMRPWLTALPTRSSPNALRVGHRGCRKPQEADVLGPHPFPESLRYGSLHALELLLGSWSVCDALTAEQGTEMASPAFVRLHTLLLSEFDESYLKLIKAILDELKLLPGSG